MTFTAIETMTALELARAVRTGEASPREVLERTLERAVRLGPRVGAFVTITAELARGQAWAAERLLADAGLGADAGPGVNAGPGAGRGRRAARTTDSLPPFLGVPVGIKDLNLVAGVPTRFGSGAFPPVVPEADDGAVARLREAGCLIVGKTATPELGMPCYTEPDIGPPARTPWDLRRSAGGSSGGSAAAVAAGVVPAALGSDGGGSIRIPASACGLVGLKVTRGRISWGPLGVDGAGLAGLGMLTRDVRDTAAFLDVLAGSRPGDQFLLPGPRTTFLDACDRAPGRLRIGVLTAPVIAADAPVHQACLDAVDVAARALADLGHDVAAASVPFPAERWETFRALWTAGAASAPLPPEAESQLVPLTRWLREQGRGYSAVEYAQAVTNAQQVAREVARAWAAFDVILCPTLAQPPALVGSQRDDADPAADFAAQVAFTPWTSIWNLTGAPAMSLPLHWARTGRDGAAPDAAASDAAPADRAPADRAPVDGDPLLPIGVQLGGWPGGEETLLAVAAQLEEALPWRHRRPPLW